MRTWFFAPGCGILPADLLTVKEKEALAVNVRCVSYSESNCGPLVLPWTNEAERNRLTRRLKVIEFAVYVLVGAMVLYSAAVNSLLVLMFAINVTALYIVLSHVYEQRAKSRQEMADKNYRNLISPSMSRN